MLSFQADINGLTGLGVGYDAMLSNSSSRMDSDSDEDDEFDVVWRFVSLRRDEFGS